MARSPGAVISRIQDAWEVLKGGTPKPAAQPGRVSTVSDAEQHSAYYRLREDRRSIIEDVKRISVTDPRVSMMIEVTASDATINGFTVVMKQSESTADSVEKQAHQIILDVLARVQAQTRCEGWAKRLIRDGDLFGQLLVDETGRIIDLTILEASITHPNKDNRGQWKEGPSKAYFQTGVANLEPEDYFADWEIVHVKGGSDSGDIYGSTAWRSARKSAVILGKSEEDLAIRRRLRTGVRYFHQVDGSWEDVKRYREENEEKAGRPFDINVNFYGNAKTNITELKGDQTIGELGDLNFFLNNLFVRGRFPKALAGYEQGISGQVLQVQLEHYYRYLAKIDDKLAEFMVGVISRALLLAGINDEAVKYTFAWGAKSIEGQDAKIARAHVLRADGAISMDGYHKVADQPGMSWETEKEKIEKEVEDFPFPPFSIAAGRPFVPTTMAETMAMYPTMFGLPDPNMAPPAKNKPINETLEREVQELQEEMRRRNGHARSSVR